MYITCMFMTLVLAMWMQLWIFNESDPDERVRKVREFRFCMAWMAALDIVTFVATMISKLI